MQLRLVTLTVISLLGTLLAPAAEASDVSGDHQRIPLAPTPTKALAHCAVSLQVNNPNPTVSWPPDLRIDSGHEELNLYGLQTYASSVTECLTPQDVVEDGWTPPADTQFSIRTESRTDGQSLDDSSRHGEDLVQGWSDDGSFEIAPFWDYHDTYGNYPWRGSGPMKFIRGYKQDPIVGTIPTGSGRDMKAWGSFYNQPWGDRQGGTVCFVMNLTIGGALDSWGVAEGDMQFYYPGNYTVDITGGRGLSGTCYPDYSDYRYSILPGTG